MFAGNTAQKATPQQNILTDFDLHLLAEGNDLRSFDKLGCHPLTIEGVEGASFVVWAPNADGVSVIGDFNNWNGAANPLRLRGEAGMWEGFVPGAKTGQAYKYLLFPKHGGPALEKSDPYGFFFEVRPKSASVVWDIGGYAWEDSTWMQTRGSKQQLDKPLSIYEVHLGSWKRVPHEDHRFCTYREMAEDLPKYVEDLGFTHVEFLPVSEHPFDLSWGYQTLGYFAPTSRFGTPQDFMYLVDKFHQHGIGVILDWVPAHFPKDGHGLGCFDGTHLYEHSDRRKGEHPDWGTYIFNYGRREVANFLYSNALFWLEKYHIDGLRLDAVASMIYLDYSRNEGEWVPNYYGGKENLEALYFIRRLNELVYEKFPDVVTIAEESTDWSMVSRPTYLGGLGFGYKWNMGWMHDVLRFISKEPVHRKFHLNDLTFGLLYAFHENFILPFSHDEVVHGKCSMLDKMPGDCWQKFANLRALYGFMYAHPGKKLLFMGAEFGQGREWNSAESLDWHLLEYPHHQGIMNWMRDLNRALKSQPALYEVDFTHHGFQWVDFADHDSTIISFLRYGHDKRETILCVFNFTPVLRNNYRIGVPWGGRWTEILNSDGGIYGGGNNGNGGGVFADPQSMHGRPYSLSLTIPALSGIYLKCNPDSVVLEDAPA